MPASIISPGSAGSGPMIVLDRVSKAYREGDRDHAVLTEASVRVERGQLVVLLGRSGSGKSTLLNLISGIDLPSSGRVWVDGLSLSEMSERERTLFRRHRIGFVFQFFNLLPTLTVVENLLLPLELTGRVDGAARERADRLLTAVGLADRAASFPERLSGGERQRVAVARSLVHDPDLVLADEPTGNLDVETGLAVIDLLDRLTRQAGKTLVMATHSPEVVGMADRILAVDHGRLVDQPLPARS